MCHEYSHLFRDYPLLLPYMPQKQDLHEDKNEFMQHNIQSKHPKAWPIIALDPIIPTQNNSETLTDPRNGEMGNRSTAVLRNPSMDSIKRQNKDPSSCQSSLATMKQPILDLVEETVVFMMEDMDQDL